MGVENSGVLYALWSYPAQAPDELSFKEGDMVTILKKPEGADWWWASLCGREGLVPSNYFGVRCQIPMEGSTSAVRELQRVRLVPSALPEGSTEVSVLRRCRLRRRQEA